MESEDIEYLKSVKEKIFQLFADYKISESAFNKADKAIDDLIEYNIKETE